MAAGAVDSTADIFKKILNLLNDAKVAPDADAAFILDIERQLVEKIREPIAMQQQAGIMPGNGGMSTPAGGPSPIPMQSGGLQAGPSQPAAADELRRLLNR
jgi:hypothetical protein